MDRAAFRRTMRALERRYPARDWARGMTPFEVLISTILSQSTTVANEKRGMDGLRAALKTITPRTVAAASERTIARAIWHAGLARQKAPRIRSVAERLARDWGGDLGRILALPTEQARGVLTSMPGVGPKTADVVLAIAGGHPMFPVDTHIARITRRWRIVGRENYEATRAALESWTPPAKRITWHLAIISLGRDLCKAQRPRCEVCPASKDCDWYQTQKGRIRDKRLRASKV